MNKINCSSFIIPIEENGNLFPGYDPERLNELRDLESKKAALRTRINLIDQRIREYHDFLARTGIKSLEDLRRKQAVLRIDLKQLGERLDSDCDQKKIEAEIAEIENRIREGIKIITI